MVEVVAKALFASSSSSDSDEFEIFAQDADTEESDAPTDPELGRADYWKCIKCKNDKNNPMYRFCEKCFQVNHHHIYTQLIIFRTSSNFSFMFHVHFLLHSVQLLIKIKVKINKIRLVGDHYFYFWPTKFFFVIVHLTNSLRKNKIWISEISAQNVC